MTKKCHPEDITDWIQDITEVNISKSLRKLQKNPTKVCLY